MHNWKELFDYSDGFLFRTEKYFELYPATRRHADVGWCNNQGYVQTEIDGVAFMLHRIIWEWHHGPIPAGMHIDHIDKNGLNNKIENLRLATQSQNRANSKMNKNNTSGHKDTVRTPNGKFQARGTENGKKLYLGLFDTVEEASECYKAWARKKHGDFVSFD